jgi:hypothetical protein
MDSFVFLVPLKGPQISTFVAGLGLSVIPTVIHVIFSVSDGRGVSFFFPAKFDNDTALFSPVFRR